MQRAGRPHKTIMAPACQKRWWFAFKDIGVQMMRAWPTDAVGAREGLNRLVKAVSADPAILARYMNSPNFLIHDWPTLVGPITASQKWTENDERATRAAIASMVSRREKACQASASQE